MSACCCCSVQAVGHGGELEGLELFEGGGVEHRVLLREEVVGDGPRRPGGAGLGDPGAAAEGLGASRSDGSRGDAIPGHPPSSEARARPAAGRAPGAVGGASGSW